VVLQVDYGAAMFELDGDDLHAVGPVPVDLEDEHGRPFPLLALRGKVPCMVWLPDGSFYIAAFADDPFAAMADTAKPN
jgi:hypothetical protein